MSATIHRIDPPLPLETPKGKGMAHFLLDYGIEYHGIWLVFIDDTGECWWVPNPEVRMPRNWTMQRRKTDDRKQIGG